LDEIDGVVVPITAVYMYNLNVLVARIDSVYGALMIADHGIVLTIEHHRPHHKVIEVRCHYDRGDIILLTRQETPEAQACRREWLVSD
jgi:hypothetical protein